MAIRRIFAAGILAAALVTVLIVAGAFVFGGSLSARAGKTVLEIRDASSSRLYGKWLLAEPKEFAIEFVHSVNQSPVRESFVIEENDENGEKRIAPKSVRFYSFGAGMQSDLEEGQTLERDGDSLVISGFSVSYPQLNYIVGTVSDHLLFINDEVISLRGMCGRNAHIIIRPK